MTINSIASTFDRRVYECIYYVLHHSESEVHMSGGGIFHASGGPLDGPKARKLLGTRDPVTQNLGILWNLWNLCQGRGSLYEIWGASAEKATGPKTGRHGEVGLR